MSGKIYKGILLVLVLVHLTLVTLGAFYVNFLHWLPGIYIIDFYQKASGADSSYGFFAPAIGAKARALFDIIKKDGATLTNIELVPASEREVQIRLGGIFDEFASNAINDKSFRQPLAASLAAAMFRKHTDAAEVILHIQEFLPNTMDEHRQGKREGWSEHYAARFARQREEIGEKE